MFSKILRYNIRGKSVYHKIHAFVQINFFSINSVNSLISICVSDLKDQKLPVSVIKTQTGSLLVAITAQIGQCQTLIPVKLFQNLIWGL